MLKNYITTAINNLIKNKLYSAINILGLAVGIAAFILLTLYVQEELSYDKNWEKADLIYRVNMTLSVVPSLRAPVPLTPGILLPAIKKDFPDEIEMGTKVNIGTGQIKTEDTSYPGSISFVDKDFIKIFQCEVISGNLEKTLLSPGNVALDEKTAYLYFGNQNPIDKTIIFQRNYSDGKQYKVTAVYRFVSPNTVFNISAFSLLQPYESKKDAEEWLGGGVQTFIRFKETVDIAGFVNRLPDFINRNIPIPEDEAYQPQPGSKMSDVISFPIQKMRDIYFNQLDGISRDHPIKKGNKTVITIFIVISLLVILIGCMNFIVLTTARATQRAKEVALRKVVGASFKQLLFQFLGESFLIALIAFIIAIALTELTLPVFEMIVSKNLAVPYSSAGSYILSILLVLSVGLLGGLYPAFVLSRFAPNRALKANKTTEADGAVKLGKILVIFQFTTSIALVAAAITAFYQLQYTFKHDPGFNPENLLIVDGIGRPGIAHYINTLKQELLKRPGVINVCLSSAQPNPVGLEITTWFPIRRQTDGSTSQQNSFFPNMMVDNNFFKTYEIPLLSGRYFISNTDREEINSSPEVSYEANIKSDENSIILNMEAAKQLGFTSAADAVGETLQIGDWKGITIVGVVADSQFRDLRAKPEPELFQLSPDDTHFLTVRYRGDYQTMVKEVRHVWNKVVGDYLFRDSNVKLNMLATFSREAQEDKALMVFSLLSVFIACMGLYGMASFTVERRVKEIGVRKVMGAKVKDIVKLLGWHFLKPVLIANIIAWPVAIFAMQNWLERFPYRINLLLLIPICLCSGLIALAIAWFTVAGNTTRVAKSKPIKALRYE